MRCKRAKRGSAVLLVVGLLTMIALLGGTLLIVSRFNARTAEILVSKSQADQVAFGELSRILELLRDDLFIDAAMGPYGASSNPEDFCDGPADEHIASGTSLSNTGVKAPGGETYSVSSSYTDLSGKIDVNMASFPNTVPNSPRTPKDINLLGLLTEPVYDVLEQERTQELFAINDELFLRCASANSPTNVGRLFEATKGPDGEPLGPEVCQLLTVRCHSRSLVRNPQPDFRQRFKLSELTSAANVNRLRQELFTAGAKADPSAGQVAHFLANLWARVAGDPNQAYAVSYEGGAKTAYGVVPQAVIVEGFSAQGADPNDPAKTWWGTAVELLNPTSRGVDLASYRIKGLGIPGGSSLGSGGRTVLYDFDSGGSSVGMNEIFGSDRPGSWQRVTGLGEFSGTINLTRIAGGHNIPVDSISAGQLGGTGDSKYAKRDDDLNRARYTIPSYVKAGGHTLGKSNGVTTVDMPLTQVYEGFGLDFPAGPPQSWGELCDIYIVGPESGGADLPHKLDGYKTNSSRGRLSFQLAPTSGGGPYPAVPWPTLLPELIEVTPLGAAQQGGENAVRVEGRINILTAPPEVLAQLPWPQFIDLNGNGTHDPGQLEPLVNVEDLVARIVELRSSGIHTPGQLAIPCVNYANSILVDVPEAWGGYHRAVNSIYDAVGSVITVNSDTYAVEIKVQGGSSLNWRYLVIVDRSNCFTSEHTPSVVLFASVSY
ncbi:MAG: hypothetical protein ACYTF6_13175 [Planctomycetota bacterium]|jgi:hypothetical protein